MQIKSTGPAFFVPAAPRESQEEIYAKLASLVRQPVPALGKRVYSIHYTYDGEQWTSTVGERCTGVRHLTVGRTLRLSDRYVVLAIFPGDPYVIVTDNFPGNPVRTDAPNPYMIVESDVSSVVLFRP